MTVALVIFVVSAQYALVKEDPTAGPISAVALYALLVLSIVSRLAGGSATIPSRPAPVSYRRVQANGIEREYRSGAPFLLRVHSPYAPS